MSQIFIVSDTHISHKNILLFRKGFASLEEHDETIISNWNAMIHRRDRVYHLGDVALGKPEAAAKTLSRLNGQIYLIQGNHDGTAQHRLCRDRFVWIRSLDMINVGGQKVVMCHYPLLSWNCGHYGSYMLHGHTHSTQPHEQNVRRMDCGVDGHGLRPWAYEEVDQILRYSPPFIEA